MPGGGGWPTLGFVTLGFVPRSYCSILVDFTYGAAQFSNGAMKQAIIDVKSIVSGPNYDTLASVRSIAKLLAPRLAESALTPRTAISGPPVCWSSGPSRRMAVRVPNER